MSKFERFLIYDDDDANTLFFEMLLKDMDISEIFKAKNHADALAMFEEHNIQFGIAAWEARTMPGTIFIQKIKKNRKKRFTPFLLYSKRLGEKDMILLQDYGVKNILTMPFDREKAREMIKNMIAEEEKIGPEERRIRQMETLIAEQKPGEALKLVDHTLTKKGPHRAHVKTLIGEIWLSFNKYDKAEKSLLEALKDTPDFAAAKSLLAKLYTKMGKHEEAIKILEEISSHSPLNINHLFNLGSAYVEGGETEKAKTTLNRVKDIDEENKEVNGELGKVAFQEGDLSLAAQLFSESENGTEVARYLNSVGITHVIKGDYIKGIESYQNAIKVLGTSDLTPLLYYNLALAQRKKGDLTGCFQTLSTCYISNPKYEKAYATLARLVNEMREKKMSLDSQVLSKIKDARSKAKGEGEEQTSAPETTAPEAS